MKKLLIILTTILILVVSTVFSAAAADIEIFQSGEETAKPTEEPTTEEENELPQSYSSLDLGYCTSVKRQQGNLCWAYSSMASMESYLLKNSLYTSDLSTDALDLWGTTRDDGTGWQRSTLEAGYTYISIGNIISRNGPFTVENNPLDYAVNAVRLLSKNNRAEIKRAVMHSGAVTANLNSTPRAYSSDNTCYCLTDEISYISGHAVSVVGWDDNFPRENFNGNYRPKENGAWLCKNSLGESFNELGGYLWISYEDYYLFNSEYFAPSYSVETMEKKKENEHLYQNEVDGATYEFEYNENDSNVFFNVFDFSENGNILDKIIFETPSVGAEYTVYYSPVNSDGVPYADRERWTMLGEGIADYEGYICCDIEDRIISSSKGAIAIELNTEKVNAERTDGERTSNALGVSEWLRNNKTKSMIFVTACKRGDSFFLDGENVKDLYDIYTQELNDYMGGTLVIKAVTSGVFDTDINGDVNIDGVVDISDATMVQKYVAGVMNNLGDDQLQNADFNKDGSVDVRDATAIQKMILGM